MQREAGQMTDIRMGLKHVILQRLQMDHANPTKNEEKRHTDFSIKRILSDYCSSDSSAPSAGQCGNILDLSKTRMTDRFQELFSQNVWNQKCYTSEFPMGGRNQGSTPTDTVVRPKVLKFWEHCALNRNCNGCEMFFKNLRHFQFPPGHTNPWPSVPLPRSGDVMQKFVMKSVTVRLNSQVDDEASYKCQICDKVFGCATTLQSHEKTHKSPRYECLDCGKGFSQLRNYKYHLSVHRGTKEFAAECPECGKTFNDKGYLSSHMKIHRNKKEYECPYCPKSFNQRVAFNMHVRIHTGVKPHKCNECGKRFSRKMLLKQHMRTHSGEKPYQCSVCGKSFADRSNMTLHHRLHSGIKPFSCPICPKAFTKKHHLKTHLNYHTGCKPYVCPHPNCNQAFTQSSNMRTHSKKCQFRPLELPSPAVQRV